MLRRELFEGVWVLRMTCPKLMHFHPSRSFRLAKRSRHGPDCMKVRSEVRKLAASPGVAAAQASAEASGSALWAAPGVSYSPK